MPVSPELNDPDTPLTHFITAQNTIQCQAAAVPTLLSPLVQLKNELPVTFHFFVFSCKLHRIEEFVILNTSLFLVLSSSLSYSLPPSRTLFLPPILPPSLSDPVSVDVDQYEEAVLSDTLRGFLQDLPSPIIPAVVYSELVYTAQGTVTVHSQW